MVDPAKHLYYNDLLGGVHKLNCLIEAVDNASDSDEALSQELIEDFKNSQDNIKRWVDERLETIAVCEMKIGYHRDLKELHAKKQKRLELILDKLKRATAQLARDNPNLLKGSDVSIKAKKKATTILDNRTADEKKIDPAKFLGRENCDRVAKFVISRTKIRQNLENGKEVPGFKLDENDNVSFYTTTLE